MDCDFGRWTGRSLEDLASQEPDAVALWLSDPTFAPHGGESIAALVGRIGAWLESGAVRGKVVAITHTAVIRAAVVHVLAAPLASFWRIDAGPLSKIELRRDAVRWALRALPAGA